MMKSIKMILTIFVILVFIISSEGQVWASEVESSQKEQCGWCWVFSIIVPGLSHLVMGEVEKGLFFGGITLVSAMLSLLFFWLTFIAATVSRLPVRSGDVEIDKIYGGLSIIFLIGALITYIWSIIDAIKLDFSYNKKELIQSQ